MKWHLTGIFLFLAGGVFSSDGYTSRDYAIEIDAVVQESLPQITLRWRNNGDGLPYVVQRRLKGESQWGAGTVLSPDASQFSDASVVSGQVYEYGITQPGAPTVSGYIMAGFHAPLIETRGKVILVVDDTVANPLALELAQLEQDLVGDGWSVIQHNVSRQASPPDVKSVIQADYRADPVNTRAVFLFGHVPVPRSGDYNADDHANHTGAWVADTYYADMDGLWTDASAWDLSALLPANKNVPGDGKFDQTLIPADLKLEVGRVDFADMPSFSPLSEVDLLRAYLNKNHRFRTALLSEPRRGLIFDGFGESGGEAFAASGWRNFAPFFTSANVSEVGWDQFLPAISSQGYLWSYAAGGGDPDYRDCYGLGQTADFVSSQIKTVFMMFFGSYFGDWDMTDCIFRAPLCSGECLAVAWAGRPHWFLHPMALGETIGYCTRLTQNNSGNYLPTNFTREVHISLLGDPTLRMHVVPPPTGLTATVSGTSVALNWSPSPDSQVLGYNVYRADNPSGPFVRLTSVPVSQSSFTDPNGAHIYMIRAVKLESTPSGTYFNSSQGVFAAGATPAQLSPVFLSNPRLVSGGIAFVCTGREGDRFVIEQSTDLKSWTPVFTGTMAPQGVEFQQSGPSGMCFYRAQTVP